MDLPAGTILESDDEIRQVQEAIRSQSLSKSSTGKPVKPSSDEELPFRPTIRPPSATLLVYDDGQATGEVVRLRHDKFIIGRSEGDLLLPDDEQISKRHVALTRQYIAGQHRWVITDLQSRNGLFVRINKAPLSHQTEFLIGNGRYRFEVVQRDSVDTTCFVNAQLDNERFGTRAQAGSLPLGTEILTEILATGTGTRIVLTKNEYWIGRDATCEIARINDPFAKGKHAKLSRSPKGTWTMQNNQSLNGVWLKLPQVNVSVGGCCEFQIGEQRFRLKFGRP